MTVTIYGLVDPVSGEVRYVGRTSKTPQERLTRHIWKAREKGESSDLYVSRWIRSVGYAIGVCVLEVDPADPREAERRWVDELRAGGAQLTNLTQGGEGAPPAGFLLSAEQRAKISAANRVRWADPAERAKLAERNRQGVTGFKGRKHSPETRERIGARFRGIPIGPPSPEARKRMSDAAKRRCARKGVVP